MTEAMLTTKEVAGKLRLTARGVHKMAARGELPGVGRVWRFDQHKLAAYLAATERKRPQPWQPAREKRRIVPEHRQRAFSTDDRLERLLGLKRGAP